MYRNKVLEHRYSRGLSERGAMAAAIMIGICTYRAQNSAVVQEGSWEAESVPHLSGHVPGAPNYEMIDAGSMYVPGVGVV